MTRFQRELSGELGEFWKKEAEKQLGIATDKVNAEATRAARETENATFLAEYRARRNAPSAEELAEMRATFGAGATVVDALTGEKIIL